MRKPSQHLAHFLKDEGGPTAVEYAVVLALVVAACVASIQALGSNTRNTFGNAALNRVVGS
jgi:pilus assembly protein Flp/PilA